MNVVLYKTKSEYNEINKVLTNALIFPGTLRAETSIMNPSIAIESSVNLSEFNYCHIEDFNRYYFISDVVSLRNNLWLIRCKVDVLMSFKESIFDSTIVLQETTRTGASNYMTNDVWVSLVKDKTDIIQFPQGLLENGEYILLTAGGL